MAKGKDKKLKKNDKTVDQPTAKIKKVKTRKVKLKPTNAIVPVPPAPITGPTKASTSNHRGTGNGAKEKKGGKENRISGFIFMCSSSTKSECYQYRVFGLPMGKMEVVEKIKPGAKLFLFDFEVKLLYGIYEATSAGQLNLEPTAFGGKFPVQVKFRIFKDCLPLPESSLRHLIKENYNGSKFDQRLNGKQVKNLLSSFRPLTSSSQLAPPPQPYVSVSRPIPRPTMEDHFKHTSRLIPVQDPYLVGMQYGWAPPLADPQTVPKVQFPQNVYHGTTTTYAEPVRPTFDHRVLPLPRNNYVYDARQPYLTEGLAYRVHDPYLRYTTGQQMSRHDQAVGLSHDHQVKSLEHYRLPLQRVVPYGRSTAPAPLQREVVPYGGSTAPAPLQREVVPYGRSTAPDPLQREVVPYGGSAAPAPYASSVMNPQAVAPARLQPQGSAPVLSSYSYSRPTYMSYR